MGLRGASTTGELRKGKPGRCIQGSRPERERPGFAKAVAVAWDAQLDETRGWRSNELCAASFSSKEPQILKATGTMRNMFLIFRPISDRNIKTLTYNHIYTSAYNLFPSEK